MNFLVSTLAICSIAALSVNADFLDIALTRAGNNANALVAQRVTDFNWALSKLLSSSDISEAQRSAFADAQKKVEVLFNKLALAGNDVSDLKAIYNEVEEIKTDAILASRQKRSTLQQALVEAGDEAQTRVVERIEAFLYALDSLLKNCSADQKSILEDAKAESEYLLNYAKSLSANDLATLERVYNDVENIKQAAINALHG